MAKKRYLTYEPRQRKILKEDRWIAVLRQEEMCSLDDIAAEIAFRTTVGKGEVHGLLLAFLEQIKYHLEGGEGVKINGLGTFYPRVIAKAVDNVEDASLKNCVKNITAGFRPESQLRNAVREAGLRRFGLTNNINDKEEDE